jgi:hypothetical protein
LLAWTTSSALRGIRRQTNALRERERRDSNPRFLIEVRAPREPGDPEPPGLLDDNREPT